MTTTLWKIPQNCTFRIEDDGTGFAYHADTDGLHPLNPSGALLMRELAGGTETEEELFERFWPEVEAQVRTCVRGDIQAFLSAMRQRHCLQAYTPEGVAQIVPPKGNGGSYAPPQVDDFGRAGLNQPTVAMAQTGKRPKAGCMNGGTPGGGGKPKEAANDAEKPQETTLLDGKCDNGTGPSNQTCETGYTPINGGQCDTGQTPASGKCDGTGNSPGSGAECSATGSTPSSGACQTTGQTPGGGAACNPSGSTPTSGVCSPTGNTPSSGYCDSTGNTPTSGYCNTGSNPGSGICNNTGQSPNQNVCDDVGNSPDLGVCTNGTTPVGADCDGTGNTPQNSYDCASGDNPIYTTVCDIGSSPYADGRCVDGNSPSGVDDANEGPPGSCRYGTTPAAAGCADGSRPQGDTTTGSCHANGLIPAYSDCFYGQSPNDCISGESPAYTGVPAFCTDSGNSPHPCVDGTDPDVPKTGGGYTCKNGSSPNEASCTNGTTPRTQSPPGIPIPGWLCSTGGSIT